MDEKKIAAQLFLDSKETDDTVLLLLRTLIKVDRSRADLSLIAQTYLKLRNNEIKIALIKSAVELENRFKQEIETKVRKHFKEDLIFIYEINEDVAGILITVNDKIIDLTVNNFIK